MIAALDRENYRMKYLLIVLSLALLPDISAIMRDQTKDEYVTLSPKTISDTGIKVAFHKIPDVSPVYVVIHLTFSRFDEQNEFRNVEYIYNDTKTDNFMNVPLRTWPVRKDSIGSEVSISPEYIKNIKVVVAYDLPTGALKKYAIPLNEFYNVQPGGR